MTLTQQRFNEDFSGDFTQVFVVRVCDHAQSFVSVVGKAYLDGAKFETQERIPFLCRHLFALRGVVSLRDLQSPGRYDLQLECPCPGDALTPLVDGLRLYVQRLRERRDRAKMINGLFRFHFED